MGALSDSTIDAFLTAASEVVGEARRALPAAARSVLKSV
jgi:hypothetical protein